MVMARFAAALGRSLFQLTFMTSHPITHFLVISRAVNTVQLEVDIFVLKIANFCQDDETYTELNSWAGQHQLIF